MSKRPQGLILIIYYKAFTAALFIISSISIFLTLRNYQELYAFANDLVPDGKNEIISFGLNKVLGVNPKTLEFGGFVTAAYGVVSSIEATGLWFRKEWAEWLVIGIVGVSIPPEIYELIKGFSWLKIFAFVLNIVIFIYLIINFLKERNKNS
jgi:uncharacterized membrane protein (DUF2068 family)